jgi:hypothetical protein
MKPWLRAAWALALLAGIAWELRWTAHTSGSVELEPRRLMLRPGEERELRLVNHEAQLIALRFRLRFDESIIEVDTGPEPPPLAPGGEAIHVPVRRGRGLVEVGGIALTGERTFDPGTTLYRLKVRGRQPGTTSLVVDDLTVVDFGERQRTIPVVPVPVTVRAP